MLLKKMLDDKISPEQIALVLISRSPTAIRNKADRMGWSVLREPEFDMAAFNKIMKGKT